jgi:hypothetical protein
MQFYFVNEENWSGLLTGKKSHVLADEAMKDCDAQPRHTGFIGAIDYTGRLRGTFAWTTYSNSRIKLYTFIRKYQAIESLETLSKMIKESIAKE